MKSRAIALGASVIALTLGGAVQAEAGVLGEAGQQLPNTGVAAKVEANVKVPVVAPSRGSLEADVSGSDHPRTTVEAKRRSGDDQSHVVVDWDSRHGVSAYADQRRKGRFELEAEGQASANHAQSTVTGFSRRAGKAEVRGHAHGPNPKHVRTERPIREHSRHLATTEVPRTSGHGKRLTPLQATGREVGNPTQLILAGWLIVLTGAGCLGVSGLVRRLQRTS